MRELSAQERTCKTKEQAFRQQLPDQSASGRPYSHAHAHFPFAGTGPRQHQVARFAEAISSTSAPSPSISQSGSSYVSRKPEIPVPAGKAPSL